MANEDWIHWSKNRLITWDDFQGIPKANSRLYAETGTKVFFKWTIAIRDDKPKLSFESVEVNAIFVKSTSWKQQRSTIFPERILKHEQGHFDITEEYSRKFKEILVNQLFGRSFSFKVKNKENYDINAHLEAEKIITNLYERIKNEHHEEQFKYDRETKHGSILKRQEEYDQRFDKLRN